MGLIIPIWDLLLIHATICSAEGILIADQAIGIANGKITWCGPVAELPQNYLELAESIEHCQGQLLTPGLIDCHTHLVYAGDRAPEFTKRLSGMSYSDIAKEGGGILSTVEQTRRCSEEQLIEASLPRLNALKAEGVTTVEIKSGYGLDLDTEIKMLRAARQLGLLTNVRVRTTFLGAHAIPPEFTDNPQHYIDYLCTDMLPAIKSLGLADAVDVFCENIAFSLKQTEAVFSKAIDLGLPIKCHAEQLSSSGASSLAASMGALSCDHLEYLDEKGAKAMARYGSVAVLLPGAFYFLGEKRKPPIALLRQCGIGIALATDCNPGSSPTSSLLLMMSMACHFFDLSVSEVLAAVTYQAAKALGLDKEIGRIAVGYEADLVHWSVRDSAALCYYFAYPIERRIMRSGKWLDEANTRRQLT